MSRSKKRSRRRRSCGRIGRPRLRICARACPGLTSRCIWSPTIISSIETHIYSPRSDGYDDGIERFTFFCRAVIRGCELLGIAPDIVHAHDWHTALLPVYLHSGLRGSDQFGSARSVYTIHNLNYQGIRPASKFNTLGLHSRYWSPDALEHFGEVNLMKGGIIFADQVTTVSPNYAHEIQTPAHGAGLDGVLRSLSFKLSGILNGIDVEEWDPETDPNIPSNYEASHMAGKALSKRALLKEAGLRNRAKTPLLSFVSRLVDQKGVDLLIPALSHMLRAGAQAVILGSGEPQYEDALARIGETNNDRCRVWIGFDNALAHRIYAGADILLMPSIYEPCGLNQMYALRYGTVPVVRLTGGLADTVIPFDATNLEAANGFGFVATNAADFFTATWLAMLNYQDRSASGSSCRPTACRPIFRGIARRANTSRSTSARSRVMKAAWRTKNASNPSPPLA